MTNVLMIADYMPEIDTFLISIPVDFHGETTKHSVVDISCRGEYHKVYYTGDTGYGESFKGIRVRYGEPELILSEGQYGSEWSCCHIHPQEGLKAAEYIGTA